MYSKRLLAMLLCISMLLAVFAVGVAAAGEEVYIEESVIVIEDGKVVSGDTSLIDSGIIVIGDDTSEEQSASTDTDCVYCEECEAYYTSSETVTETETENARLQVKDTVAVTDTSATSANTPDLTPKLTTPDVPGITTKYNRYCNNPNIIYQINPNSSSTSTDEKNEFNWRKHRLSNENITIAESQIVELQFAMDITEFTYEMAWISVKFWRYKSGTTVFLDPMFHIKNGKTFNVYGNNDNYYAANVGMSGLTNFKKALYLDGRLTSVNTSSTAAPTSLDSSTNVESPLIYVEAGGTFNLWDTYLRYNRNKAGSAVYSKKGGAAYVAGKLYIKDSEIQNCTADYGGGIYVANGGNLELNGVTIQNCTSTYGGAIYVEGNATLKFTNVNVIKNSATYGGGLYINNGFSATISDTNDLVIGGSDANKNTATNGGGIYVNSGTVELNNVQVNYNTANAENGSGGGMYIAGGEVTVKGTSAINNNVAYNNGGAIRVTSGAGLTVSGTTEIKNNYFNKTIQIEEKNYALSSNGGQFRGTGSPINKDPDVGSSYGDGRYG
ncbi:MAG: hypothetical protein IJN86_02695, partial [Clostridia bacterium]|nr:hypothetical protein [Clostridia bacterium]